MMKVCDNKFPDKKDEYQIDDDGWTVIGSHYVNLETGKILSLPKTEPNTYILNEK